MYRYSYIALSERAPGKKSNEDRVFINGTLMGAGTALGRAEDCLLAAVCDGVGGTFGGGRAAESAAGSFFYLSGSGKLSVPDLDRHILRVNEAVGRIQKTDRRYSLMASALAGLVISDGSYRVFNLGDSRVYLYAEGRLRQLTRDHTLARQKLIRGELADISQALSKDINTLTRYIGGFGEAGIPFIEPGVLPSREGCFLLCTDGISKYVPESRIISLLGSGEDLKGAGESIMKAALENGCRDDRSLVIIRFSAASQR